MYKSNKYNNKNIRNTPYQLSSFSPFTNKYYTLRAKFSEHNRRKENIYALLIND